MLYLSLSKFVFRLPSARASSVFLSMAMLTLALTGCGGGASNTDSASPADSSAPQVGSQTSSRVVHYTVNDAETSVRALTENVSTSGSFTIDDSAEIIEISLVRSDNTELDVTFREVNDQNEQLKIYWQAEQAIGDSVSPRKLIVLVQQGEQTSTREINLEGLFANVNTSDALDERKLLPAGMALSHDESQIYVASNGLDSLISIDIMSGKRTILSNNDLGDGPRFENSARFSGLQLEPNGTSLLATHGGNLYRVTIETGNRELLSSATQNSGPSFASASGFTIDPSENSILVSFGEYAPEPVLNVSLETGERSWLRGSENAQIIAASKGAYRKADSNYLVYPYGPQVVIKNLANGRGGNIIPAGAGEGPRPTNLMQILELASEQLLLINTTDSSVIKLDLYTMGRELIAPQSTSNNGQVTGLINQSQTTLYIVDEELSDIQRIDLVNNSRQKLLARNLVEGPSFLDRIVDLHWLADTNELLLAQHSPRKLQKKNLTTGELITLVDQVTQYDASGAAGILAYEQGVSYVLDPTEQSLVSIDAENNKRIISRIDIGTGPIWLGSDSFVVLPSLQKAFVLSGNNALYEVNLNTGDRAIYAEALCESEADTLASSLQFNVSSNHFIYLCTQQNEGTNTIRSLAISNVAEFAIPSEENLKNVFDMQINENGERVFLLSSNVPEKCLGYQLSELNSETGEQIGVYSYCNVSSAKPKIQLDESNGRLLLQDSEQGLISINIGFTNLVECDNQQCSAVLIAQ